MDKKRAKTAEPVRAKRLRPASDTIMVEEPAVSATPLATVSVSDTPVTGVTSREDAKKVRPHKRVAAAQINYVLEKAHLTRMVALLNTLRAGRNLPPLALDWTDPRLSLEEFSLVRESEKIQKEIDELVALAVPTKLGQETTLGQSPIADITQSPVENTLTGIISTEAEEASESPKDDVTSVSVNVRDPVHNTTPVHTPVAFSSGSTLVTPLNQVRVTKGTIDELRKQYNSLRGHPCSSDTRFFLRMMDDAAVQYLGGWFQVPDLRTLSDIQYMEMLVKHRPAVLTPDDKPTGDYFTEVRTLARKFEPGLHTELDSSGFVEWSSGVQRLILIERNSSNALSEASLLKSAFEALAPSSASATPKAVLRSRLLEANITSLQSFLVQCHGIFNAILEDKRRFDRSYGQYFRLERVMVAKQPASHGSLTLPTTNRHDRSFGQSKSDTPRPTLPPKGNRLCRGCGAFGSSTHSWETCPNRTHPNWNDNPKVEWLASPKAQALVQLGVKYLQQTKKPAMKSKCFVCKSQTFDVDIIANICLPSFVLPVTNVLLDTGAVQNNFISWQLWTRLEKLGVVMSKATNIAVCSCFGERQFTKGEVLLTVIVKVVNSCSSSKLSLSFLILNITHFDLIIGKPSIDEYNLLEFVRHAKLNLASKTLNPDKSGGKLKEVLRAEYCIPIAARRETAHSLHETAHSLDRIGPRADFCMPIANPLRDSPSSRSSPEHHGHPLTDQLISKDQLFGAESNLLADEDHILDRDSWFDTITNMSLSDVTIEGDINLQRQLKSLVARYSNVFQPVLPQEAARVYPMGLEVDEHKWQVAANRTPARFQSPMRHKEIERQVSEMLSSGVIRKSEAEYWSHVLLTPKANGKLRLCVDFRALNEVTKGENYPLPNPEAIFLRIGQRRRKRFAVIDLTSGYHQVPLAINSRKYTAFMTHRGVFEYTRIPFGLKGAPSFFQRTMETILQPVLFTACEIYLDDVIVYGDSDTELVSNLEQVLLLLRKHNIKANPAKARLGLQEIEYVGHVINEHGTTFSRKKLDMVVQTPIPNSEKQLKSFLGTCNYFRTHIQNYATIVAPLHRLLKAYTKKSIRKVVWTSETTQAFDQLKEAINNCPQLYFVDDGSPIILQTDASDYGIGATLLQRRSDGTAHPVAFISKALSPSQIRTWAANEKEAYAIIYALKKLDHYLRDVHFTIETDHRNLTFLVSSGSPRVLRWKLSIQEYDFVLKHIPGPTNVVADHFSRGMDIPTIPHNAPPDHDTDRCEDCNLIALLHADSTKIPDTYYKVISRHHNSVIGHHGVQLTLEKLSKSGVTWKNMRLHVRQFIKKCPVCQKDSDHQPVFQVQPYTLATDEPMARISIDSIGPFPTDINGNEHILVIIDNFTRYVELYAVKDTTAESAAKALLNYFGRYGAPYEIVSDSGTQFVNTLIKSLMASVGTDHIITTPYSHEENGIVERCNKQIVSYLRAILFDRNLKETWGDALPIVQRICNSTVHASIGMSPTQLLFGTKINIDRGFFLPYQELNEEAAVPAEISKEPKRQNAKEWVEKMTALQQRLLEAAQRHQNLLDEKHVQERLGLNDDVSKPKRPRTWKPEVISEFPVGSYVLVNYRDSLRGRPDKTTMRKRGPLQVFSVDSNNVYTLKNLVTLKLEQHHITALTRFEYDPDKTDPRDVANRDAQVWDVDVILDHRGDPKGTRKQLEFLVAWSGFPPDKATWEPFSKLRQNMFFQQYLRSVDALKHLVNHRLVPMDAPYTELDLPKSRRIKL